MTTIEQTDAETSWYSLSADEVVERLDTNSEQGLATAEVQRRLTEYGPNEIATEPPPTLWQTAKGQLLNPMNIMLLVVAVASLAIGQVATGIVVGLLVAFNVVMGTNQQRKATASVEALAERSV